MNVEQLLLTIAQQGLVGVLLVLSLLVNYTLYRELRKKEDLVRDCNEKRVNDLKEIMTRSMELQQGIRLTLESILGLLQSPRRK